MLLFLNLSARIVKVAMVTKVKIEGIPFNIIYGPMFLEAIEYGRMGGARFNDRLYGRKFGFFRRLAIGSSSATRSFNRHLLNRFLDFISQKLELRFQSLQRMGGPFQSVGIALVDPFLDARHVIRSFFRAWAI